MSRKRYAVFFFVPECSDSSSIRLFLIGFIEKYLQMAKNVIK